MKENASLLTWLRDNCVADLYRDDFEAWLSAALGPGLLGHRAPRPAPGFLRHLDLTALPAESVVPFLRRISLTSPVPGDVDAVLTGTGPVTTRVRTSPPFPETSLPGIPYLAHTVWLGGPAPQDAVLRANIAAAARHNRDVQFVVWTDVPRAGAPTEWVHWAAENDVLLVNVDEVFHADAPMLLHEEYGLEVAKRLTRGLSAASDHLRLEVLDRFGGLYLDGDNACEPGRIAGLIDAVAAGPAGFTVHVIEGEGVDGDLIVAPAGHPVLRLWQETARTSYGLTQRQLFGGDHVMASLGPGIPEREHWQRSVVARRAGRNLGTTLSVIGFRLDDQRLVRVDGAVRPAHERSWAQTRPVNPGGVAPEPGEVLNDLVATTVRRLISREGDLQLTAVAPVIAGQPEPGRLWVALIARIAELAGKPGVPAVTTVTEVRIADSGEGGQVRLPPEVDALLYRGDPATGVWRLGELTVPARFGTGPVPARPVRVPDIRGAVVVSENAAAQLLPVLVRRLEAAGPERDLPLPVAVPDLRGTSGATTLAWLRRTLDVPIGDPEHERRLLGRLAPDLFGLRRLLPEPDFLHGIDQLRLPANRVASFLAGISLTRPGTPRPGDLDPRDLALGRVSRVRPGGDWGVPGAPRLPSRAAIPHLVHGIWLGGPAPENGVLRESFGAAARHYAGRVRFVIWTDITRAQVNQVTPAGSIHEMLDWAREHDIAVVSVAEVFHAAAPMRLWWQYTAEMTKLLPRGYAGASDRLRQEILARFGGAYVDGDNHFLLPGQERLPHEINGLAGLPELFSAVAASEFAFTPHVSDPDHVDNDVIVAPARHPAILLWREIDRLACSFTQDRLFGQVDTAIRRAGASDSRFWHRYDVSKRTGLVHSEMMRRLELTASDRRLVRAAGAIRGRHVRSWARDTFTSGPADVVDRVAAVIQTLLGLLHSRPGNLQLTAVAPVVRALPDPDAAWIAALRMLAVLADRKQAPQITSVTRFRWSDDGTPDYVGLPAQAESLLIPRTDSHTIPVPDLFSDDPDAWFGQSTALPGMPAWILDEMVVPAHLLPEPEPVAGPASQAVVTRASWLPAGFVGVTLQGWLGSAWADSRRVTAEQVALRLSGSGPAGAPVLLRMSGGPENGTAWFARRLSGLLGRPVTVAHETGQPMKDDVGTTADALRSRLATQKRDRLRAAARLTQELAGRLPAPGTAPRPSPSGLPLAWLRRLADERLYTDDFEAEMERRIGPDPYRRRARTPRPAWQTVDPLGLLPHEVSPFLRWLDLVQATPGTTPDSQELDAARRRGDGGPVSSARRPHRARTWGMTDPDTPRLPAEVVIPRLVHGIWISGPLPEAGGFRANFGGAAREYAGRVDFVLWTDVTRAEAAAAAADPDPEYGGRIWRVRSMLDWARENGILVVDLGEVYHEEADFPLWSQTVTEWAKRTPLGYGAAVDHLRVQLVTTFGGSYADGDDHFAPGDALIEVFDAVAASETAFTLNVQDGDRGVNNDIIMAPARHPALLLWREFARLRYLIGQHELYGGELRMTERFVLTRASLLRYSVVLRSGRRHHDMLGALGLAPHRERLVRIAPSIEHRSELTWAPGRLPEVVEVPGTQEILDRLVDAVSVLARQLINRPGNLFLTEVAPIIRTLPDPAAAWIAVLTETARLQTAGEVRRVTSVTHSRWDDQGRMEIVDLPPEAEAMLVPHHRPRGWLGAGLNRPGQPVWIRDEAVEPCRLRVTAGPAVRRVEPARVYRSGQVLGLRYVPNIGAGSFPPGSTTVWAHRWCGQPWSATARIRPEEMALDLFAAGLHERPVLIVTAPGERISGGAQEAGLGDFAARLGALLGVPVTVVDAPSELVAPVPRRDSLRQREPERGSLARRRLRPDPPAVPLDDAVHGGQTDTGAGELALLVQPLEG
ncbi:hypothetical protein [Kineosporia mesophila]|uniref:hypothetical protein n=1 Tax=Kineosporia mesophila TaxID=566012 RepID=UPI002F35278D